jgi:hypothetical protein
MSEDEVGMFTCNVVVTVVNMIRVTDVYINRVSVYLLSIQLVLETYSHRAYMYTTDFIIGHVFHIVVKYKLMCTLDVSGNYVTATLSST